MDAFDELVKKFDSSEESVARRCRELNPCAFIEKGVTEDIDRLHALIEQAVKTS